LVGGLCNTSSGYVASVGGGQLNIACKSGSVVVGGRCNTTSGDDTIVGGFKNTASGYRSVVGGECNTTSGYASVSFGKLNTASGNCASILGGSGNTASGTWSGVFGCDITNSCACSFMSNQLRACNIFGAGAICADAGGTIVPSVSDCRLKENILPLDLGLGSVLSLNPVSYEWKNKENGCGKHIGFIAQEIKEIIPSSVFKTESGYYGFDMNKVVPVLANSIKELKGCNDSLRYEIDILKSIIKNNNLA